MVVPKDALISRGSRVLILAIDGDDRAQAIEVETGRAVDGWIAVTGDLSVGDRVIVRGNERLQPGAEVMPEQIEYPKP